MKKTTRILGILLAVFLGVFACIPAFAAPEEPLIPDTGNLFVHKYFMEDISGAGRNADADADVPNDGTELTAPEDLPAGAVEFKGVSFSVYLIGEAIDPTTEPPEDEVNEDEGKLPVEPFTLNATTTELTDAKGVKFGLTSIGTEITNASGLAKWENLDKGLYLVVEQAIAVDNPGGFLDGEILATIADPFIVAVPMTDPSGTGWLENVHCYPKNSDLNVEKKVSEKAVGLGDKITWTVIVPVPAGIADYDQFDIVDELDPCLDFAAMATGDDVTDGVKVSGLVGPKAAPTDTDPLTEGFDVEQPDAGNDYTLKVVFTKANFEDLADYNFIKLEFDTIVNQGILQKQDYTHVNVAKLEFDNGSGVVVEKYSTDPNDPDDPESTIHSAAIRLTKIDAQTGDPLPGAKFQIASSPSNATNGLFLKKLTDLDGNEFIIDTDHDLYDANQAALETYFGDEGATLEDWIETSEATAGYVEFKGLKEKDYPADTYKSYYIVEVEAPGGYNLYGDVLTVTFSATESEISTNTGIPSYTMGTVTAIVINNSNLFTLPRTGGMGTILFTAGGVALILLAALLFVQNARKKKSKISV